MQRLTQLGKASLVVESSKGRFPGSQWQDELVVPLELTSAGARLPSTTVESKFSVFRCPSDTLPTIREIGDIEVYGNFVFCFGSWLDDEYQPTGIVNNYNDDDSKPAAFQDLTRGSAKTAMISETLTGATDHSDSQIRLRQLWMTPGRAYELAEKEAYANACASVPADPIAAGWGGLHNKGQIFEAYDPYYVSATGVGINLYNHILPPQSPSCTNAGSIFDGITSASSGHHGVVNVCFCDGHVESISQSIDTPLWQTLGKRN